VKSFHKVFQSLRSFKWVFNTETDCAPYTQSCVGLGYRNNFTVNSYVTTMPVFQDIYIFCFTQETDNLPDVKLTLSAFILRRWNVIQVKIALFKKKTWRYFIKMCTLCNLTRSHLRNKLGIKQRSGVCQLFVDFKKAYDSLRWEICTTISGISKKLGRLIKVCLNETCRKEVKICLVLFPFILLWKKEMLYRHCFLTLL
jgi:hypothetical protein